MSPLPAVSRETDAWIVVVTELPRIPLRQSIIVAAEDSKVPVNHIVVAPPILLHVVVHREPICLCVPAVVHNPIVRMAVSTHSLDDVSSALEEEPVEAT